MPLGPRPGLDRLLQSASKLRDRRPGIGRPCLQPARNEPWRTLAKYRSAMPPAARRGPSHGEPRDSSPRPPPCHHPPLAARPPGAPAIPGSADPDPRNSGTRGLSGPSGDPVGAFGSLQEQLERRATRLDPGADLRIGFGPGDRRGTSYWRVGWEPQLLVRPPEKGEGILILGDAQGRGAPPHRTGHRCPGARSGSSATRPPGRAGDARSRPPGPTTPTASWRSRLRSNRPKLRRRTTPRRRCRVLGLDRHEKYVSRRSQLVDLTFGHPNHDVSPCQ